jgi:hypothetical protein
MVLVFVVGLLTAFHWSFFFWFIEIINGKDTLLMGLTLGVQCFLGELPFFLISERVVQRVGPSTALSAVLFTFGVRYLAYGYLITAGHAYYVLVVELTQGPTFGLFYTVMTALAQDYALRTRGRSGTTSRSSGDDPPLVGEEGTPARSGESEAFATMQAVFSGCYEGAGLGAGGLLAGLAIDNLGITWTWRVAGFMSFAVCGLNVLADISHKYVSLMSGNRKPVTPRLESSPGHSPRTSLREEQHVTCDSQTTEYGTSLGFNTK